MKLELTVDAGKAVALLNLPGAPGFLISRSGRDDREALAQVLRALGNLLDAHRRTEVRNAGGSEWVRMNIEVDVRAPARDLARVEKLEAEVMSGSRAAGEELLALSTDWIDAALHDSDARRWRTYAWELLDEDEAEDDDSLGMA
jgi:hypothetical protein